MNTTTGSSTTQQQQTEKPIIGANEDAAAAPPAPTTTTTKPTTEMQTFRAADVHEFAKKILIGNGVPPASADVVAKCLVAADLRGVDSHGINRIPSYMARIREGVLDPQAVPTLHQITPE